MVVKKAVFPVGGWGTRFLPATKAIPKAMFPIINKPIIHYVVDEIVAAGIHEVFFTISPHNRAIEEYFGPCNDLDVFLKSNNKEHSIEELRNIRNTVHFSSTTSRPRGGFHGLGVSVLAAGPYVGQEPFAVVLPNDMIDAVTPCMKSLVEIYNMMKCPVLAIYRVPLEQLTTYGNVRVSSLDRTKQKKMPQRFIDSHRVWEVTKLVQKPDPKKNEHLSDYAIIGRFILPPEIFPILQEIEPGFGGEIQLIDAIERLRQLGQTIYAYEFEGQYFDTRSEKGYLMAILNEARNRNEIWNMFRNMVADK